jgi:two-component system response regulator YesN
LKEIYSAPNYDSVRHAFRKTFGCSPREMLQRLRLEHAKTLLLESRLSIKEVALQVGYASQNDFNRLFHRHAGLAPSKWRMNPMPRKPDG